MVDGIELLTNIDRFLREQSGPGSTGYGGYSSNDLAHVFFVDSGHANKSNNNDGRDPNAPLATIDGSVGKTAANRGDIIIVMSGYTETLTAKITCDVAGITIIGIGEGLDRPQLTVNGSIDGIDVTAADVTIENIYFNEATDTATSNINIAAARCKLRRVHMDLGTNDIDAITVTAAGELPLIEDCTAIVTANGPDSWVKFEGVIDRPVIRDNIIVGSDGTNAFDDGVLDFNAVAVTNPIVYNNLFLGGGAATTVAANTGGLVGTLIGPNVYAGSATSADNVSSQQEIVDALYGSAGIDTFPNAAVPANGVSLAEVLRSVWAGLMGTAAGENGITSWPVAAAPGDTVSIAEAIRYIVENDFGTLVNAGGTATLGGILGDVANVSIATRLTNILAAAANGAAFAWGICDAGMAASQTIIVSDDLTGYGDDFFNGRYYMQVLVAGAAAPEAEVRLVTDYVSATGTFTCDAFSVNVEAADVVLIIHESSVAVGRDDTNNVFASTNVAANEDGSVLERLEQIQEAVNVGSGSSLPANTSLADFVGKGTGTALPANTSLYDVLAGANGIPTWPAAAAPADTVSLAEAVRYIVETLIGTLVNTGGTASIGGILGDLANDSLVARLNDIGTDVDSATTDNIQGKLGTDTELADRSLYDILNGGGPAAAAAAAAPANDVSLYAVLRAIYDRQIGDGTGATANSRLGKRVQRAAADIFDGTQKPLFTISGGRVLITQLTVEVSVSNIDAGASATRFVNNPTVGTDRNMCATLDINADEVGTIYSQPGLVTDALEGGSGGGAMGMDRGYISAEGTIDISTAADVGTGGALGAAEIWYIPLDTGASIATA